MAKGYNEREISFGPRARSNWKKELNQQDGIGIELCGSPELSCIFAPYVEGGVSGLLQIKAFAPIDVAGLCNKLVKRMSQQGKFVDTLVCQDTFSSLNNEIEMGGRRVWAVGPINISEWNIFLGNSQLNAGEFIADLKSSSMPLQPVEASQLPQLPPSAICFVGAAAITFVAISINRLRKSAEKDRRVKQAYNATSSKTREKEPVSKL